MEGYWLVVGVLGGEQTRAEVESDVAGGEGG